MSDFVKQMPPWRCVSPGRAVVAGLAGSLVNTLAIRLAQLGPIPPGTGGLAKLTLARTNGALEFLGLGRRVPPDFGPVGQEIFHTVTGVLMALAYALFFYRWLRGAGWLRGLVFCQLPWLTQAFGVLPWLGAGALGLHLSTLTPVVSFVLNALYGVTLGALYRPRTTSAAISTGTANG